MDLCITTEEVEGVIGTTKDFVGNGTPLKSMDVTNLVHEANKNCIAESHECVVVTYIVNPHEFYIATKEDG